MAKTPPRKTGPEPLDAQPFGARDPRLGRLHDRVLEVLGEVSAGQPAERALRALFKRARDLGPSERERVQELVYGFLRSRRAIDDQLSRAARAVKKSLELLDPPVLLRLRLLVHLALEGAPLPVLEATDAYAARRLPGALQRIVEGRLPPVKRGAEEALAVELSYPDWLVTRLVGGVGLERAREILAALNRRAPLTLRANRLRTTRDALARRLREGHGVESRPTLLAPDGLILSGRPDLSTWPETLAGELEPQDEGSQLIALATGSGPDDQVLDACAGAGGKTLALAALMQNRGKLVALEPEPAKLEELRRRLRRAGVTNTEPLAGQLEELPERWRGTFSRVLVDAPCTGSGVLRRMPDLRWRLEPQEAAQQAARQLRLVAAAAGALAPGGLLTYATCSILPEEDEALIQAALRADPRLEPVPLATTWGGALAARLGATHEARIGPGPGEHDPDGFYLALLRRR